MKTTKTIQMPQTVTHSHIQLQSQMKNSLQYCNWFVGFSLVCHSTRTLHTCNRNEKRDIHISIAHDSYFIKDKFVDFWLCLVSARFVCVCVCGFICAKSTKEKIGETDKRTEKKEETEENETVKSSSSVH